ncbi:MAG: ABC transporter permease, partial [Clostridium sp.]
MNFKYAIKGMKRNLIFNLLLFIQVSLAFTVIYKGIEIDTRINAEIDKIFNFFKDDKIYTIKDIGSPGDEYINHDEMVNLLHKINKEKNTTFTQQVDVGEVIHCFDGYEKFLRYEGIGAYAAEGVQVFQVRNLLVNENFLETFNVKLDSGKFFEADDYKRSSKDSKTSPVILGYDFKEHFKIGDIIKTTRNDSLEVIGFAAKNQVTPYVIDGSDNYINLNKFMIRPYTYPRVEYWYNFLMFDKFKSDEEIAKFIFSLQKDFQEKIGVRVDIEDLSTIINENLDIYKMQKDLSNTAMVSIIFFLLLSLIVTNLNLIIKRKKEF